MWARARYDLGIGSAEFYQLTPRQFLLLMERRREHLAHVEILHGMTTAAVRNSGFCPPEKPASPLDYTFHHRDSGPGAPPPLTEEELERQTDYNIRVAELAAEMREQANHAV